MSREQVLAAVKTVADSTIRIAASAVDREGRYPIESLRQLGEAGAFAQHLQGFGVDRNRDLATTIDAMALAGTHCGCTSFLMWLQAAFGWYLEMTENTGLRDRLQGDIAAARLIGTSGMSNPVKSMDGIESFKLRGERVDGGYIVSGVLPYVSNLGDGHYMGTAFELANKPDHKIMAVFQINGDTVKISPNVHFIALEGSGTYTVVVKKHFVADDMILADPMPPYVKRIKPAFFLMQAGIALGQIQGCVALMRDCDRSHLHVNQYLPKRPEHYEEQIVSLAPRLADLLADPLNDSRDYMRAVYQIRLDAGELALDCAQSALLHAGAKGYVLGSDADRRFRETLFVAIVTPATKHLRKVLAEMPA